jgi:hypothetical protein
LARPRDLRRIALDAAAAAGLLAVLVVVWAFDPGASSPSAGAVSTNVVDDRAGGGDLHPASSARRTLRLAVTPPEYDDMGKLLATLGSGYQYTEITMDDLLDADRLAEFDVIFLTCGGVPDDWLGRRIGGAERGAAGSFHAKRKIADELHKALRSFVGRGGTLYVSDWQFQLLDIAFPEFIDSAKRTKGDIQSVRAEVVDSGLIRRLGSTIELRFDKRAWYPAAFKDGAATTCLRGKFTTLEGRSLPGELLVKLPFEAGNVIFTSFHNEAQHTQTETELLRYLVFATVTAREEANVKRTMVRGGFSPKERNLLSASSGSEPVAQMYECRRAGPLQFVLGFEDQGAQLRMTITGPGGAHYEQAGSKTFRIEIPDARPGVWQYTITPVEVPYQNFPFILTIGEKQ